MMLRGPYEVLRIKLGWTACKASASPPVLSYLPGPDIFDYDLAHITLASYSSFTTHLSFQLTCLLLKSLLSSRT